MRLFDFDTEFEIPFAAFLNDQKSGGKRIAKQERKATPNWEGAGQAEQSFFKILLTNRGTDATLYLRHQQLF